MGKSLRNRILEALNVESLTAVELAERLGTKLHLLRFCLLKLEEEGLVEYDLATAKWHSRTTDPGRARCPYLLSREEKICLSMVDGGLESEVSSKVSSFDIKHFCDGDPTHCYYYRFAPSNN